jgi:hypothetical protein
MVGQHEPLRHDHRPIPTHRSDQRAGHANHDVGRHPSQRLRHRLPGAARGRRQAGAWMGRTAAQDHDRQDDHQHRHPSGRAVRTEPVPYRRREHPGLPARDDQLTSARQLAAAQSPIRPRWPCFCLQTGLVQAEVVGKAVVEVPRRTIERPSLLNVLRPARSGAAARVPLGLVARVLRAPVPTDDQTNRARLRPLRGQQLGWHHTPCALLTTTSRRRTAPGHLKALRRICASCSRICVRDRSRRSRWTLTGRKRCFVSRVLMSEIQTRTTSAWTPFWSVTR